MLGILKGKTEKKQNNKSTDKQIDKKSENNLDFQKEKSSSNPYLNVQRKWDDRYGTEVKEKKVWQIFSIVSLSLNIVLVAAVTYYGTRSQFIPYALKTTDSSPIIEVSRLDATSEIDPKIIASQLAQFVSDVRTVTTDGKLKKKMTERVYSMCSSTDGAISLNTVQEWLKKNDPFEIAKVMNISVTVTSVMALNSTNTYQIQWTETAIVNGLEREKINWTGLFEATKKNLTTWTEILNNPTGLVVKSISWSQVI